jgi:hypothetical protein
MSPSFENIPSVGTSEATSVPEALSDKELVLSAVQHNLSDEAASVYAAIFDPSLSEDDLRARVQQFNALDASERGADKYDHSRPLTENHDSSFTANLPSGKSITITLHKGEVSVEVPTS